MSRTLKLKYDFNDAANLEVEFKPGQWARVTANWFRSFIGPRRVDGQPYRGPVYYEGSNYTYRPQPQEQPRLLSIQERNQAGKPFEATKIPLLFPNKRQQQDIKYLESL